MNGCEAAGDLKYVSRISIVMPYDFRVWTLSWTSWPTGTSSRSDVIVSLSCLDSGFVSQCLHAQFKAVKNLHISTCFAVMRVGFSAVFFAVFFFKRN